jgi:hypothetical protein
MRAAQRQLAYLQKQRRQKAYPVAVSACVGGWNTRDSLDEMKPTDAVVMDNWFPGLGSVYTRGGSSSYATTLGGPVKTLAEFNAKGLRKFIAAANANIWNISSSGAGVSLASGFARDDWQTAQFDDASGGPRLGLVNGSDAPQIYDGATVGAMTVSGVGLTVTNLNGIHIFKSRSYFWDNRTQDFWYSATNALGGVLVKFPLGRVTNGGGNLIAMGTWSVDAGDGMADMAVFVLNSGDVLVYAGDDPGTAASWVLKARYSMGAPLSTRAVKKVGSELIVVTRSGYIPLSKALPGGRVFEQKSSISDKIRGAALEATKLNSANFGWDVAHYPSKNMLIVNVPLSTTQFQQHVMNTETGSWCRFTGLDSLCWGLYNDALYFGTSAGTVLLYDPSLHGDLGNAIVCELQSSWNYLGDRRKTKRATGIRPLIRTTGGVISYGVGVGFDFQNFNISIQQDTPLGIPTSPWDSSPWDVTPWSAEFAISNLWSSIVGDGYCVSMKLNVSSGSQGAEWLATNYLVEPGGVL